MKLFEQAAELLSVTSIFSERHWLPLPKCFRATASSLFQETSPVLVVHVLPKRNTSRIQFSNLQLPGEILRNNQDNFTK